ncbi:hypothetical protein TeGR_g498 [Tetraparma gracilis]|uniref:Uncharacterized protein n=1 Tax=Tetraparma gracilis TaxID=2962635 RepID=A0ABQ6MSK7_9STRA|nr:hypothetical protein TeGR_g498 [Tetraparma gracilis]
MTSRHPLPPLLILLLLAYAPPSQGFLPAPVSHVSRPLPSPLLPPPALASALASKKAPLSTPLTPSSLPAPLLPLAELLDGASDGWAFQTADLSPETPSTPLGAAFLATNLGFLAAGTSLALNGSPLLGLLTDAAGLVSFWYHYDQLQGDAAAVRLSLLVDYLTAGSSLLLGLFYLLSAVPVLDPLPALLAAGPAGLLSLSPPFFYAVASSVVAVSSLLLCWVWEYGLPYLLLHSVWHLASAVTCYFVGVLRADTLL